MAKIGCILLVGFIIAIGEPSAFAQFGGRGMGGIFGGQSRTPRSGTQNGTNSPPPRPAPDSYEVTEHRLALMEYDLHLTEQQKQPWQTFASKVRIYAGDLSREHALTSIPASETPPVTGLQHIDLLTDGARIRVNELEDIQTAAKALYATLSDDQKKAADARMTTLIVTPSAAATGDSTGNYSGLGSTTRSQH
jgi:hypothetical protein